MPDSSNNDFCRNCNISRLDVQFFVFSCVFLLYLLFGGLLGFARCIFSLDMIHAFSGFFVGYLGCELVGWVLK